MCISKTIFSTNSNSGKSYVWTPANILNLLTDFIHNQDNGIAQKTDTVTVPTYLANLLIINSWLTYYN